jgi:hypothetical protein
MRRCGRLSLGLVVLSGTLLLAITRPARAQECMVGTIGPLFLTSRQTLTLCATNLDAQTSRRVGFAFYDAFEAREPLRLQYADLALGAGACSSFQPSRDSLTVVARAGFVRAAEDSARPLALSAQIFPRAGVVDAADYVVWRSSFGANPPPPPV